MKCPFTGKPCLNPKDIQYTESNNGESKTMHLCQECGSKYMELPQAEVVASTLEVKNSNSGISHQTLLDNVKSPFDEPCPQCGATIADILKEEKVGCPACYDFHEELDPMVQQCQGAKEGENLEHVGKHPQSKPSREEELRELHILMKIAVNLENYERAAELRDKIKQLENQN